MMSWFDLMKLSKFVILFITERCFYFLYLFTFCFMFEYTLTTDCYSENKNSKIAWLFCN